MKGPEPLSNPPGRAEAASLWVGALVFAARLPFLTRSYGFDGDAWSVARAARQIAETGTYEYSRPPGYPFHEGICALFQGFGPVALNGLTALFSAMAAAAFVRALQALACKTRDAILAALALSFTPVVALNSAVTLDYVWALAWILLALNAVCRGRAWAGGLFLGLAVGCRITSGAMAVPLAILLAAQAPSGLRTGALLRFVLAGIGVGALCFVPVWLRYGPEFLGFVDIPLDASTRARIVGYGITFGSWGLLGTAGVCLGGFTALVLRARARALPRAALPTGGVPGQGRALLVACVAAVALYLVAFIRFPAEYAYFMPALPFIVLLLLHAPASVARVALLLILVSPIVGRVDRVTGRASWEGMLRHDHRLKQEQFQTLQSVYAHVNRLPWDEVVLVVPDDTLDRFRAMPDTRWGLRFNKPVTLERSLSPPERERHTKAGRAVYLVLKRDHCYDVGFLYGPAGLDGSPVFRVEPLNPEP